MAQFDEKKQSLKNNNNNLYEVQMQADRYGNILTEEASAKSAFGESVAVQINPVIQEDGIYGLSEREFETFNFGTGTFGTVDSKMQVATGTGAAGYAVIRSRRTVRYRSGQGALARFTAKFTEGVAGYTQRAGFFSQESAVMIGYDGTSFGVLRDTGGKAHIEELTITTAAVAAQAVEWNIGGTIVSATLTISDIRTNMQEIFDQIPASWIVEATIQPNGDGLIRVLSTSLGVKAASSFTDTGTSGLVATTDTVQTGVAGNPVWTPQAEFNGDKLDGTGPSRMVLDPTKLNVFQINFRWLGAGRIQYSIENDEGLIIVFHTEIYTNRNEQVHISDPSMKIGYVVADLAFGGGTGVTVEGGSFMGGIEGNINNTKLPVTHNTFLTSALTVGVVTHIFSICNRASFASKVNLREAILSNLSCNVATASGNAQATFYLFYNALLVGGATPLDLHEWQPINETQSLAYYSEVAGTFSLTDNLAVSSFEVSSATPLNVNLYDFRIVLPPQTIISVAVKETAGAISGAGAALNWIED